jgi:hypothetical protein
MLATHRKRAVNQTFRSSRQQAECVDDDALSAEAS